MIWSDGTPVTFNLWNKDTYMLAPPLWYIQSWEGCKYTRSCQYDCKTRSEYRNLVEWWKKATTTLYPQKLTTGRCSMVQTIGGMTPPSWIQIPCNKMIIGDWICQTKAKILPKSKTVHYICPKQWHQIENSCFYHT